MRFGNSSEKSISRCIVAVIFTCSILSLFSAFHFPVSTTFAEDKAQPTLFERVALAKPRIQDDMKYLSDDERDGRGPKTEGLDESAAYIQKIFDQAGLKRPELDKDGFQEFMLSQGVKLGEKQELKFTFHDNTSRSPEFKKDFEVCSFGSEGEAQGELVFAGYAISSPGNKYDDFENLNVEGKVAIIFRKVPRHKMKNDIFTKDGVLNYEHAALTSKIKLLKDRKAKGVIIINDPATVRETKKNLAEDIADVEKKLNDEKTLDSEKNSLKDKITGLKKLLEEKQGDELMTFGYGGVSRGGSIPTIHITGKLANELLKNGGSEKSIEELEQLIDKDLKPQSFNLTGVRVELKVSFKPNSVDLKNVVAVLEGEGDLKEETIIVGAHYDHVGMGQFGSFTIGANQVHNGADDNASGTSALLEVARYFGANHKHLPRRIVFIAFSGEELGLLGSADYVSKPLYPLKNTVAMFNLDMVGRAADNKVTVFGTKTSSRWEPMLNEAIKSHKLNMVFKSEGYGPSDHASFYKQKIPVLHFFTGLHGDYHRPSDDSEKINIQGISRIACLIEELVIKTANQKEKPDYVEIAGRANVFNASGTTPYLGTIPDLTHNGPGYKILSLAYDSPALKAGINNGDVITKIDQENLVVWDDINSALNKFKADQDVTIQCLRNGQAQSFNVKLSKPR